MAAVALMSRRAEDELGQAGDKLTREETLLLLVHPEDLNDVRAFLAAPISTEATIRFRSKHGQNSYLLRRAPMVDASGTMRAHIHYFTDITPLEEARRARDEALSLISHDLRAPQAAILAALNKPMNAEQKTFITRQAQRTMRLAESFVDLARMRERDFAGEEFLLSEVVAEVADDFHPLAEAKHIRIVQHIAARECFVVLEMDSIIRALANLFDNAVKFSPEGGVIDVHLTAAAREGRDGYALSIRDHGDGIDPALLPRLFGRFQRAEGDQHAGEARRPSGFGLGLSYVAAVVERHDGHDQRGASRGRRCAVHPCGYPPPTSPMCRRSMAMTARPRTARRARIQASPIHNRHSPAGRPFPWPYARDHGPIHARPSPMPSSCPAPWRVSD